MKYRILKEDIKRFLFNKNTLIAFIMYFAICVLNIYFIRSELPLSNPSYKHPSAFDYFVIIQGGGSGFLFVLLPLIVTLSTGDLFIKERTTSILSYSLIRVSKKRYIVNKITSIGIGSFLFLLLTQLILLFALMIVFPISSLVTPNENVYYALNLFIKNPFLYCLLIAINSSLMAIFFSILSIIISIYIKNIYASLILPYVTFIGISQVLMAFPMIFEEKGIIVYNLSPLVMTGDYITNSFEWFIVPIYWIVLIFIIFRITTYCFINRFKNEKLLLH